MDAAQIIFLIVAAVTLGAALMVVTTKNLIHAALWLILALFGVAVFYVLLSAGFLAIAQVVIYIGAIAILIIFAVMMTRGLGEHGPAVNASWWMAGLLSLVFFAGVGWMLSSWEGFHAVPGALMGTDPLVRLGEAFVDPNGFVLPFELASVLLVAAMIGAIMIAYERVRR